MTRTILAVGLIPLVLAWAVGATGSAHAASYVVDQAAPGAADTNTGTEQAPFKTIQHAADVVRPGDSVLVMAGKYDERVKVTTSGTEGQPITLRAAPRQSVVVGGFDLRADYVRVQGFEITADKPAVAVHLGGSHCEVLDIDIHDMMVGVAGTVGKPSPDGKTRDYSAVAHNRIAYNKVYSSRLPSYRGAWGLDVIQTPDVTIENNTFAGIPWCGVGLRGQESTHGQIRNNLFYDMQQAVLDGTKDDFSPANPLIEYNLAFKTARLAMEKHINDQDPLLRDAEERDFRLRKGSPAIGAGQGGATIGALDYPNVYYVDPRHPAATDEPAWGYPAVPLASLAKACALVEPGETIVLRGGVYRETLRPENDGVMVRAMKGERVTISGADRIEGWTRETEGRWSAPLPSEPRRVLRDGQRWTDFTYDQTAKRIVVKGGDPRMHLFETAVREQGIEMGDKQEVKIEGITVTNTLEYPKAN